MTEASELPEDERELRRIQEVARYYCATNFPLNDVVSPNIESTKPCDGFNAAASVTNIQPVRPVQISPEPTLTALAQLGALKLDCQRSFVSIIDHNSQYVLAEATRSVSLLEQDVHTEDDALYLGIQSLPLYWGVCPSTMKTFTDPGTSLELSTPNITANRTRYIVRDFLEEARTKDRPYVVEWPFMRFYAEVPIRSPTGYVIGGYCVIDNKPRGAFDDAEVQTLQEISDCIANHLELMRMKQDFERAERLMKGLSSFVEGQSSIRLPSSTGPPPFRMGDSVAVGKATSIGLLDADGALLGGGPTLAIDNVPEHAADPTGNNADANHTVASLAPRPLYSIPQDASNRDEVATGTRFNAVQLLDAAGGNFANTAVGCSTEGTIAPSNIKRTFSRASNLIRESMDLCGVVFFDAYLSGLATRSKLRTGRPDRHLDVLDNGDISSGDDEWAHTSVSEVDPGRPIKQCKTLGQSLTASSPFGNEPRPVPEFLLRRLLRKHPHGQIFSSEHSTFVDDTEGKPRRPSVVWQSCGPGNINGKRRRILARQADSQLLFELLPGACSIVFYPLWDSHKARWFAGCIGWTIDPKRALQSEEVTYLAAFGNSVMAEINRIEAVANDIAKSDFISNISHELRSPLHGILASAELLQDSSTGPDQDGMIEMVHVCGRTLLDTMNHLLDHAKINNLSKSKRASSVSNPEKGGMHGPLGLVSDFDLSELVEEVVESVHTGYQYQKRLSASFKEGTSIDSSPTVTHSGSQAMTKHIISVLLDIEVRTNWIITSEAGAWRRIVMNLFGNSLKYTQSGFIKVAVWADEVPTLSAGLESTIVHLSVTDTGKGISEDYLKNRLYTPFAQEDALSVGAGLGLSIVQQIVTGLRGTVDIQSKIGCGTNVTVSIPLTERPTTSTPVQGATKTLSQFRGLTACLVLDSRLDLEKGKTAIESFLQKSRNTFYSSISRILANQFGMKVIYTESDQTVAADVFMIEEERLDYLNKMGQSHTKVMAWLRPVPLIVLCQSSPRKTQYSNTNSETTTYITQPFGSVKLAKALNNSLRPRNNAIDMRLDSMSRAAPVKLLNGHSNTPANRNCQGIVLKADPPQQKAMSPPGFRTTAFTSSHCPRVLLVDDNDINLKIMVTYMRKLQCSFEVATDGLQAYEKYRETAERGLCFNHVLMDVSMPVMDGLSATREIRAFERGQGLPSTNIIALTGLASTKTEEEAFASGVDLFLTKPVQLKKLKDILHFYDDQNRVSQLNGGPTKKRKIIGSY